VIYVTSANLTEATLYHDIELGFLVRDRSLGLLVSGHFQKKAGGLSKSRIFYQEKIFTCLSRLTPY